MTARKRYDLGFPVVRLVEIHGPLGGTTKAFKATVEAADGERFQVCVKPCPSPTGMIAGHLFANWCGDVVAATIGVPVPPLYLLTLDAATLSSLGPTYADAVPGFALASRFQEGGIIVSQLIPHPEASQVRNPESTASAVVLDTLFQNNDRGSHNVLAIPHLSGKYELCFIDNGWLVWFPPPMYTEPLLLRHLRHPWLFQMVTTTEPFDSPVFLAETLNRTTISARFRACPKHFRDPHGPKPTEVVAAVFLRASRLRDAVHALGSGSAVS